MSATTTAAPARTWSPIAIKLYLTLLVRRLTWTLPAQDRTLTNELFPLPDSGLKVSFTPASVEVAQ